MNLQWTRTHTHTHTNNDELENSNREIILQPRWTISRWKLLKILFFSSLFDFELFAELISTGSILMKSTYAQLSIQRRIKSFAIGSLSVQSSGCERERETESEKCETREGKRNKTDDRVTCVLFSSFKMFAVLFDSRFVSRERENPNHHIKMFVFLSSSGNVDPMPFAVLFYIRIYLLSLFCSTALCDQYRPFFSPLCL